MKKLKIYLETTAVSNLDDQRNQESMTDMRALWELLIQNEYEVVISWVVMEEIENNKKSSKIDTLKGFLSQIEFEMIDKSDMIEELAEEIILNNILTRRSIRDCQHIACAMISNCDCIVSYNFNDINNIRTIKGIQALSMKYGYINMNIITARSLLNKGEDQ